MCLPPQHTHEEHNHPAPLLVPGKCTASAVYRREKKRKGEYFFFFFKETELP